MDKLRTAELVHKNVQVWCMDEHRVGRIPILKRVWAKRGERLIVPVETEYEWLYIYAFICPETGESRFWITTAMNTEMYQEVLKEFRKTIDLKTYVLLVEDGSATHFQKPGKEIAGIEAVKLPPYSPELQPAECIWKLTDIPIVNRSFNSLKELETKLLDHCGWLQTQFDLIRRHTLFHWWPLGRSSFA